MRAHEKGRSGLTYRRAQGCEGAAQKLAGGETIDRDEACEEHGCLGKGGHRGAEKPVHKPCGKHDHHRGHGGPFAFDLCKLRVARHDPAVLELHANRDS